MARTYQQFGGHNRLTNCRVCGKRTHSSIDGNVGIALCRACYEDAGMENEHSDGHHDDAPHPDCTDCQYAAQAKEAPAAGGEAAPRGFAPTPSGAPAPIVHRPVVRPITVRVSGETLHLYRWECPTCGAKDDSLMGTPDMATAGAVQHLMQTHG
jgi:hypothetical protein